MRRARSNSITTTNYGGSESYRTVPFSNMWSFTQRACCRRKSRLHARRSHELELCHSHRDHLSCVASSSSDPCSGSLLSEIPYTCPDHRGCLSVGLLQLPSFIVGLTQRLP